MRKILKNYLKSFFKNSVQSCGIIIFIVLIVTSLVTIFSGPLQFIDQYNNVANQSKQWEFKLDAKVYYGNFKSDFINKYYYNENVSADKFNNVQNKILDHKIFNNSKIMIENLQNYYYDQNNHLITDYGKGYLQKYDNNYLYGLYDYIFNGKINQEQYDLIFEPNAIIYQQLRNKVNSAKRHQDCLYIQSIIEKKNNKSEVNRVVLKGKNSIMPQQTNLHDSQIKVEILISENYAKKNNIKINDELKFDHLPGIYKVTGYATSLNTFTKMKDWQKKTGTRFNCWLSSNLYE